jgi:hypothetical protein
MSNKKLPKSTLDIVLGIFSKKNSKKFPDTNISVKLDIDKLGRVALC